MWLGSSFSSNILCSTKDFPLWTFFDSLCIFACFSRNSLLSSSLHDPHQSIYASKPRFFADTGRSFWLCISCIHLAFSRGKNRSPQPVFLDRIFYISSNRFPQRPPQNEDPKYSSSFPCTFIKIMSFVSVVVMNLIVSKRCKRWFSGADVPRNWHPSCSSQRSNQREAAELFFLAIFSKQESQQSTFLLIIL